MTLTDIIAIAVIAAVVGLAVIYIVKEKKKGAKCIGCPHSKSCHKGSDKTSPCCCKPQKNDRDN